MSEQNRIKKIEEILNNTCSPAYRKKQVLDGIYRQCVEKYSEMTNTPKAFRELLERELGPEILSIKNIHEVEGGQVHKILFDTYDKQKFETVRSALKPNFERSGFHHSLCISSQAGCALGCTFCATGKIGFKKNLTADEISDQILYFKQKGLPIDSVSFMGMGEPFANPNLFDALKIITDKNMLGLSRRRLSISTVGIIPGIQRLTKEFPEINLAFSLHSPFAGQRLELMPITKAFPINKVMEALREHVKITNKKVFIAYVLLKDVNDSVKHAKKLSELIKAQKEKIYLYHVNLIRFNPTPVVSYEKTSAQKINAFRKILDREGIRNTLRQSFGVNIEAACGQLYGKI